MAIPVGSDESYSNPTQLRTHDTLADQSRRTTILERASRLPEGLSIDANGDFNIDGGGSILVHDCGGIRLEDGGHFSIGDEFGTHYIHLHTPGGTCNPSGTALLRFGDAKFVLNPAAGVDIIFNSADGFGLATLPVDTTPNYTIGGNDAPGTVDGVTYASGNRLGLSRDASSIRYKTDVTAADPIDADIDKIRWVRWRDKARVEKDPDIDIWGWGVIAEELDEIPSLRQFIRYLPDENGELVPDGVCYERLLVAVIASNRRRAKAQQEALDAAKGRIAELERLVSQLVTVVNGLPIPHPKIT